MLMAGRREAERISGGFGWVLRQIAETVEPWSEPAIALRDKIADLVWGGREQTQEPYEIRGVFNYLAQGLAMLCDRQLSDIAEDPQSDLIRACVIASRFGAGETGGHESVDKLRAHFDADGSLRSNAFWAELAFMDEVTPADDDWDRYYHAHQDSLTGHLTELDRSWLETALADDSRPKRRAVALHALIDLWRRRGRIGSELDAIRENLKGNPILDQILADNTAPLKRDENWEREHRLRRDAQAEREAERLEDWRKWRDELLEDPAAAFSGQKLKGTVSCIYLWLSEYTRHSNRFNNWNKEALTQAFNLDIAERAENAFRAHWRTKPPALWSTRLAAERNNMPQDWIHGLIGVSAEALTPGWTASLSPDEARTAAAYATIELNGFAPFIADLANSHPAEVEEIIGAEVSAELEVGGDHHHLPTLQNLSTRRAQCEAASHPSPALRTEIPARRFYG